MTETEKGKIIAALYADLRKNALGTTSRIAAELGGIPVLRHTARRLAKAEKIDEMIIFCPESDASTIQNLVDSLPAEVIGLKEAVPVSSVLGRRKWSLRNWRGGIHEAVQFDEQVFTGEMIGHLAGRGALSVFSLAAEAVLVDASLVDGLVQCHQEHLEEMRFTFTIASPGLCGCAYRLDLLAELVRRGASIGNLLNYDPDSPQGDLISQKCNHKIEPIYHSLPFRFIADQHRSFQTLDRLFQEHKDLDTLRAIDLLSKAPEAQRFPQELEIEITTEPSLRVQGYPHHPGSRNGGRLGVKTQMSLDQFQGIVRQIAPWDDVCITLGLFGEPLSHPNVLEMIEAAHQAGVFGIHIETDGIALEGGVAQGLAESPADVISVYIDADDSQLYQKIKGQDLFDKVQSQLADFIERCKPAGPQVLPTLVKCTETLGQMESFYDRWLRACGGAVIQGWNDFAGQIQDRSVMNMDPPRRIPCRHLSDRLSILADGSAVICSQDFKGQFVVGDVFEDSIDSIWQGPGMQQLRDQHKGDACLEHALCGSCHNWYR